MAPAVTTPEPRPASRRERWVAWHPLLFAAYPVLFLWSQNLGEARANDVLPLLVMIVAAAAVALAILTLVFRDARRAALIVTPAVVGLLMYGHVANVVGPAHLRSLVQQAGWALLVVLGLVAALRLGEAGCGARPGSSTPSPSCSSP